MRVTYRIPTEMYAYVEVQEDVSEDSTSEGIEKKYRELADAFRPKPTNELPQKEWNKVLDKYRLGEGMSEEEMHQMSPQQAFMIKELDKSDSRLGIKN